MYDYLVKVVFCYSDAVIFWQSVGENILTVPSASLLLGKRFLELRADNENALQDNGKQSTEILTGC